MKLVLFAHSPPPHHGQSQMVKLMLDGFGGDQRSRAPAGLSASSPPFGIECYHVNARLSSDLEDVGHARTGKVLALLRYVIEAVWLRFRFGADTLYYVPAPPQRPALYRDWLVMLLCRPFFRRVIFHWHAFGLGEWLGCGAWPWERWITRWLMGGVSLSIVLSEFNRQDAQVLRPRRVAVVPNGIPDPCPDFEERVLPRRLHRAATRAALLPEEAAKSSPPPTFQVAFLGLCVSEKGLFDAVEAVALANQRLESSRQKIKLLVGGAFCDETNRRRFEERIRRPDLAEGGPWVEHRGFVSGAEKQRLLTEADCLCFPTYYRAESFGLVLCEAMAYGLPVVTTRWRTIPELLADTPAVLVDIKSPAAIADGLILLLHRDYDPAWRQRFLRHYTIPQFLAGLRDAIASLETEP